MSADNGIYILKTDGPEWRVAHCQAIDSVFYKNPEGNNYVLLDYFEKSPVFSRQLLAEKFAGLLYEELMHDDIPICEYGIVSMQINRPFPEPKSNTIVLEKIWGGGGDDDFKIHGTDDYITINRYSMGLQGLEKEKADILVERGIITQKECEDLIRLWENND